MTALVLGIGLAALALAGFYLGWQIGEFVKHVRAVAGQQREALAKLDQLSAEARRLQAEAHIYATMSDDTTTGSRRWH